MRLNFDEKHRLDDTVNQPEQETKDGLQVHPAGQPAEGENMLVSEIVSTARKRVIDSEGGLTVQSLPLVPKWVLPKSRHHPRNLRSVVNSSDGTVTGNTLIPFSRFAVLHAINSTT